MILLACLALLLLFATGHDSLAGAVLLWLGMFWLGYLLESRRVARMTRRD